jgi:hypothetical protein
MIKKVISLLKFLIFVIIILIISIETLSFVATKFNLLIINEDPDYYKSYGNKWRTENTEWGSWHKPNFKDKHTKKCFDVTYESNNLGARDDEDYNKNLPKDSIILIGDSFAEGYGVNLKQTFSKILENKTGRKVLNFGSAGHFGAVQQEILYRKLASKLPHNEILYFFLPSNDFTDNDRSYWNTKFNKFRYRPYFKKIGQNNYDIFYPEKNNSRLFISLNDFAFNRLQTFLIKYTYTANTLRSINVLFAKFNKKKSIVVNNKKTGDSYFFDNEESINGTLFFTKNLLLNASNKKRRIIVIIPTLDDLNKIENGKIYKDLKWYKDLKKVSFETNTKFFDLAEVINKNEYTKMLYKCDNHWNPSGHKFVADLIIKKFF